jgi:hypothetical protein
MKHHLDARHGLAALPRTEKPRRDYLRIVEYENVARLQKVRQIAHALVGKCILLRPDDEHARRITRPRGTQGDTLFRESLMAGHTNYRHDPARPGHPRLLRFSGRQDVDGPHKAGHDDCYIQLWPPTVRS